MRYLMALGALALLSTAAHAEVGLSIICTKPGTVEGAKVNLCAGFEVYNRPQLDSMVRSCGPTDTATNQAGFGHRKFDTLASAQCLDTCTTNIKPGTKVPSPWTAATDKCKAWASVPKTGVMFILASGPGNTDLSWTAPTQWAGTKSTDNPQGGDTITVPITYNIYGSKRGVQTVPKLASTTALAARLLNQPIGDNCYFVTAVAKDSTGVARESEPSATACKQITFPGPTDGKIEGPSDGAIESKKP